MTRKLECLYIVKRLDKKIKELETTLERFDNIEKLGGTYGVIPKLVEQLAVLRTIRGTSN